MGNNVTPFCVIKTLDISVIYSQMSLSLFTFGLDCEHTNTIKQILFKTAHQGYREVLQINQLDI